MPINTTLLFTCLCLCLCLCFCLIFNGCDAYLIDQSGEVVEAFGEATTMSADTVEPITVAEALNLVEPTAVDTAIRPYNILETKPLPHCPEGYILANKRCHKRVRKGVNAPKRGVNI